MESSCPSILSHARHPVGRPDMVLKWWLHVFFPFTYKVLLPHSFFYYHNYYFSCEKRHPEKFPRVLGHLISFNNKASQTSWPCQ
jgi:hypothetical protein